MTSAVLSLENVSFRYGERRALDQVSLELVPGRRLGLLGPNGSGKSTLLQLVVGLLVPSEGRVRFRGESTSALSAASRRKLAVAFQKTSLDVRLTVRENLRCFATVLGLSKAEASERIARQLKAFDLEDRADARVGTLSGGLARRADLARALLTDVDLLILDEPTTGLDPIARKEFWSALDRRLAASGAALLVATHLFDEAERLDEVLCLREGRIAAKGEPGKLVGALPESVLRLKTTDGAAVVARLRSAYGLDATAVGDEVLCVAPNAVAMVPKVVADFEGTLGEITVRRPSLEDAFFATFGETPAAEITR